MARSHVSDSVSAERADEIADLAEAVAEEHCPSASVDPAGIAGDCGLTISFGPYMSAYDGMLEHKSGKFHIYCNTDRVGSRDEPRARFTVSHELGHYFVDEHRAALAAGRSPAHRSCCEYQSKNLVEQEADHFASNLLMPKGRFLTQASLIQIGFVGIRILSKHFQTSVTSTTIRFVSQTIVPCALVKWTCRGHFQWKRLSKAARQFGFRRTIERHADIPTLSPTWRALNGDSVPDRGFFTAETAACAWFQNLPSDDTRRVVLVEQAMPIGRYGVITFLYHDVGAHNLDS